ncbi:Gifsy-2 prophage protein [Salmonella enterica subsp. enterica serovar Choleraesuis str. SCSA50]|uniref:Gifsy-2 prophage protein n=2 Tax=Salmonella enterica subsp. enterica serovar Choleraesuis TaxID=119912 RepID=Q57QW7_SALCH|nr:Gifsy-2 prophage protein [Salmonella enterica subsp. enterica serovar Choleraesuis str. SC-B67]EFZ05597.1 Gifsy-2 prophage protein [Salmonella enterica subsp. enterica serovar Choleraesuis str. SCSA50]
MFDTERHFHRIQEKSTTVEQEIKSLELNITQLSAITGAHRQTIASRLKGVKTSGGNGSNLKIYRLVDILTAMMTMPAVTGENDPNKMKPSDRRAWFQSEMTQKIIDQLREDLASMTYQACADAINGDDDDNGDEGQEEEQE